MNSYVLFAHKNTSQSITQSPSQPLPNTLVNQQLLDNLSNNFARQLSQHESISFVIARAWLYTLVLHGQLTCCNLVWTPLNNALLT